MITLGVIQRVICKGECTSLHFGNNKMRDRELVLTRQIIWYFGKRYTKLSLYRLGLPFKKDHATVLHGIKAINNLIDTDREFRARMQLYDAELKGFARRSYDPSISMIGIEDVIRNKIVNHKLLKPEVIRYYNNRVELSKIY